MKTNDQYVDKLNQIRRSLPHGSGVEIGRITGLSKTLISRVLNGKATNMKVMEAAYQIIEVINAQLDVLEKKHEVVFKNRSHE